MDYNRIKQWAAIWLFVSLSGLLTSCSKPADQAVAFSLRLKDRSDARAVVGWTDLNKSVGSACTYAIFLDGEQLASGLSDTVFVLSGLRGNTKYNCEVVAYQTAQQLAAATLQFSTFTNYPPNPFSLFVDTVTSHSVSLQWQVTEPENRPLRYDIFLNGKILTEGYAESELKLTGLTPDIHYVIRVEAIDDQENRTAAALSVVTLAKEGACLLQKKMSYDGGERTFVLYLPSYLSSSMPLLMHFHGAGGYAWKSMQDSPFKALAEQEHFIVVFPQATIWDQPDIPSWNVSAYNPVDDVGFAEVMLQELTDSYPINPDRVYACGMSSGGFMTYALAFSMREKLAAIAPVAGFPTAYDMINHPIQSPLPLLHIHGTRDSTVPYLPEVPSTIAYFVEKNFCDTEPVVTELPNTHPEDGSFIQVYTYESPYHHKPVVLYRIEGGGHSWPGSASDPYANKDIVVEWEIWKFFRQFAGRR